MLVARHLQATGRARALASPLETKVRQLLKFGRFRDFVPRCGVTLGRTQIRVDFGFPRARLAVEAEGYTFHHGRKVWKSDLARRNELALAGWQVYDITWEDLNERERVIEEIRTLLHART